MLSFCINDKINTIKNDKWERMKILTALLRSQKTARTTQWSGDVTSHPVSSVHHWKKNPKGHQRLNYSLSSSSHISYKRVLARFCNIIFPLLFQLFCNDLCTAATIPQQNSKNNGLPIWGRRKLWRAVWLWKLHLQLWACRIWRRFNQI